MKNARAAMTDVEKAALWATLAQQLREQCPNDKVTMKEASWTDCQVVTLYGVDVEVRLGQERSGGFTLRYGRPYFTVGAWSRHRARQRAVEGKDGFDWKRVVKLIVDEATRLRRHAEIESERDKNQKAANKQLRELLQRKPALRAAVKLANIGVNQDDGTFNVVVDDITIGQVEAILSALARRS